MLCIGGWIVIVAACRVCQWRADGAAPVAAVPEAPAADGAEPVAAAPEPVPVIVPPPLPPPGQAPPAPDLSSLGNIKPTDPFPHKIIKHPGVPREDGLPPVIAAPLDAYPGVIDCADGRLGRAIFLNDIRETWPAAYSPPWNGQGGERTPIPDAR